MTATRPPAKLPAVLTDVADEAIGRRHRNDPVLPGTGGPAGNARLTAWTGLVLLLVTAAELLTLFDVNGPISWHVAIGTVLLVVALVKTGSTGWRVARYYSRDRHYRSAGPPPLLLRLLGPLVVLSTLGLVASGLVLIGLGPDASRQVIASPLGFRVDWVTVYQGVFVIFAVAVGLHLLARIVPALRLTVIPRVASSSIAGGRSRVAVLLLAAVVAAGAATIVVSVTHGWGAGFDFGHHRQH